MGVADPVQQGRDFRRVMRVVRQDPEPAALKKDILPATDAAPPRQGRRHELTRDQVRHGQGHGRVRAVESTGDRQGRLHGGETATEPEPRVRMVAGQEGGGVVTLRSDPPDLHRQTLRQTFQPLIARRNDHGRAGALEQGTEDAFERRFVAVVIGMIPIQIHGDGDVGRKSPDGAIAFVDLRHHPRRSGRSPRRREIRVAKKPPEDVAEIRARRSQRRDQHPAGRGLAMAAAYGDEATARHALGQQLPAAQDARGVLGREVEGGMARLDGAGATHDEGRPACGPRVAQQRDFSRGQVRFHRTTRGVIPPGDIAARPFEVNRQRSDAHAARTEHPSGSGGAHPAEARGGRASWTVSWKSSSQRFAASARAKASRISAKAALFERRS